MGNRLEMTFNNLKNVHFVEIQMDSEMFSQVLNLLRDSRSVNERGLVFEGILGMAFEDLYTQVEPSSSPVDSYDFLSDGNFVDVKYTESIYFKNHIPFPCYIEARKWMDELLIPKYINTEIDEDNFTFTLELVDLIQIHYGEVVNRVWPVITRKVTANPIEFIQIKYIKRIYRALDTHHELKTYGKLNYQIQY